TGAWCIGYHITFGDLTNNQFRVTRLLGNGWEAGTEIGFHYFHSQNTTTDTVEVFTGSEIIPASEIAKTTTSNFIFSIAPLLVRHFSIANNLDFYAGGILPVNVGPKPSTVSSNETTAEDYFSSTKIHTKNVANNAIGIGGVAGCRYFFYTNLALGAEYSLTALYYFQKGNIISEINIANSGSNNPESGSNFTGFETQDVNAGVLNIGTFSNGGVNLTFYF
ncbi:MAG: hypothetical protein WBB36_17760, partial [Chitinophagales bacterium]